MTKFAPAFAVLVVSFLSISAAGRAAADRPRPIESNRPVGADESKADLERDSNPNPNPNLDREAVPGASFLPMEDIARAAKTVGVFALISLAPAALLMVTAFVRIQIVLTLLRQALGTPQVPGNQVVTALALLLTALVMKPTVDRTYVEAVQPFQNGRIGLAEAWRAGSEPIKEFMIDQIYRARRESYLRDLRDLAEPRDDREPAPENAEDLSIRIVAPAFLMSELTTALMIGFAIYLPFLVIDLVVSVVLAAMGLVMLPPTLVSAPLKLVLFALAGGWWPIAAMLLRSFGTAESAGT